MESIAKPWSLPYYYWDPKPFGVGVKFIKSVHSQLEPWLQFDSDPLQPNHHSDALKRAIRPTASLSFSSDVV